MLGLSVRPTSNQSITSSPIAHLPVGHSAPTVGIRCNPILFELQAVKDHGAAYSPFVTLPYRMIFAVLSTDSVMLYDTQYKHMLCMVRHQHFANLTDVAWSNDGRLLLVTSTDGRIGHTFSAVRIPKFSSNPKARVHKWVVSVGPLCPRPPPSY